MRLCLVPGARPHVHDVHIIGGTSQSNTSACTVRSARLKTINGMQQQTDRPGMLSCSRCAPAAAWAGPGEAGAWSVRWMPSSAVAPPDRGPRSGQLCGGASRDRVKQRRSPASSAMAIPDITCSGGSGAPNITSLAAAGFFSGVIAVSVCPHRSPGAPSASASLALCTGNGLGRGGAVVLPGWGSITAVSLATMLVAARSIHRSWQALQSWQATLMRV